MADDNTLDYVLSPAEAAASPDQAPASGLQRMRIHIPQVSTTLSLGAQAARAGVRGGDLGPINRDGFCVHTMGHITMAAQVGTIDIKAKENIAVSSANGCIDVRAAKKAYFGSDEETYLHSKNGTLIVGGGAAQPDIIKSVLPKFAGDALFGANDAPVVWTPDDLSDVSSTQDQFAAWSQRILGTLVGIESALGFTTGLGLLSAVFGGVKAVSSLAAGAPGPGVGIHGTESVVVTSPKTVMAYSHKHTLVSSAKETEVLSGVTARLGAGVSAFVGSTLTTVLGMFSAKMVSGKVTEIASRLGHVDINAPEINVGNIAPKFPQKATDNVKVVSKKGSVLGSESYSAVMAMKGVALGGGDNADVFSKKVLNMASKDVNIGADKAFSMSAGSKFGVICGKTQVSADKNRIVLSVGDEAPAVPPTEDSFYARGTWSNHNEFLNAWRAEQSKHTDYHSQLKHAKNSWTQVKVTEAKIQLKIKGGSEMMGDKSGWKIAGTKIVVKK